MAGQEMWSGTDRTWVNNSPKDNEKQATYETSFSNWKRSAIFWEVWLKAVHLLISWSGDI